jgi:hypothetical protein
MENETMSWEAELTTEQRAKWHEIVLREKPQGSSEYEDLWFRLGKREISDVPECASGTVPTCR